MLNLIAINPNATVSYRILSTGLQCLLVYNSFQEKVEQDHQLAGKWFPAFNLADRFTTFTFFLEFLTSNPQSQEIMHLDYWFNFWVNKCGCAKNFTFFLADFFYYQKYFLKKLLDPWTHFLRKKKFFFLNHKFFRDKFSN